MKNKYSGIFLLTISIFVLLGLPGEVKATDLASEFTNLPCTPTNNANLTITGGAQNLPMSLGTDPRWAGAIGSLKVNGQETVLNSDPGLLMQYAFQLGGKGEADNPTEGGAAGEAAANKPTSSVFIEGCSNGRTLYTKSQMAYWYPVNGVKLSPFIMSKLVQIGVGNMPNLIRFVVRIHSPSASEGWQLETPTSYHIADFKETNLSVFDLSTNTMRSVSSNEFTHILGPTTDTYMTQNIIAMSNNTFSLVPYMPHLDQFIPEYPGRYYYAVFHSYNDIIKWDILTYKAADPNPGDYYYESYLLVSPNTTVVNDIKTMLALFLPSSPIRTPTPTHAPTPKPGDLNGDGKVDIYDYNILIRKYGNPYTQSDYNQLLANFGK